MSGTILIIEDEEDLRETLAYNLESEGYEVRTAANGEAGLEQARREPIPDLLILDLMLPDISGTEICRQLRHDVATRSLPVVMLTAKTDEIDRVVGFEVGADDYITKPFSVRELLLRVRAVLRRSQVPQTADEPKTFGRLRLDVPGHRTWVDGEPVELTALEFRLLETFWSRRGRVQSREALMEEVWGTGFAVTERTVDTHIKRLRAKLGAAGGYIETLRGVGYRFRDSPSDAR